MSSKGQTLVLIIIFLALIGGGIWYYKNKTTSEVPTIPTSLNASVSFSVGKKSNVNMFHEVPTVEVKDNLYPLMFEENVLTLNEAKAACQSMNMKLASKQDLLEARSRGFEKCQFTWLDDGQVHFVMQNDDVEGCNTKNGINSMKADPALDKYSYICKP